MMGEALGAHSERVEAVEDLVPTFQRAADRNRDGQPALVEVMVKEEPVFA